MTQTQRRADRLPATGYVLLVAMTVLWGINWPIMKIALGELPVWTFRSLCLVGGSLGLLVIARLTGQRLRVARREIGPLVLTACFSIVGWHVLSAYGVSMIPATRAVIIAFTMPLWAGLLAWPILGERPSPIPNLDDKDPSHGAYRAEPRPAREAWTASRAASYTASGSLPSTRRLSTP